MRSTLTAPGQATGSRDRALGNGRISESASTPAAESWSRLKSCAWNETDSDDVVPGQQSLGALEAAAPHPSCAECMGHASANGGHAAPATETNSAATRKTTAGTRFCTTASLIRFEVGHRFPGELPPPVMIASSFNLLIVGRRTSSAAGVGSFRTLAGQGEKQMPTTESDAPQSTERRASFRVPLSRSSRWEFRLRRGFFDAIALDVAEGGMFVR